MDNQRLFTFGLFGLMLFICYNAWQVDYGPQPAPVASDPLAAEEVVVDVPAGIEDALPDVTEPVADTVPDVVTQAPVASVDRSSLVRVTTDVLELTIDLAGGDINGIVLPAYPVAKNRPDDPVTLMSPGNRPYGRFQTGLIFAESRDASPTHLATFTARSGNYALASGSDTLTVPLTWQGPDGVTVTKTYTFQRGSYRIDIEFSADNPSAGALTGVPYGRIVREATVPERSMFDVQSYSFTGPVTSDGKTYDKHDIDDLIDGDTEEFETAGGWIGAIQYHFALALVPPAEGAWRYKVAADNRNFLVSAIGNNAAVTVPAGGTGSSTLTVFAGPKLQKQLEEIAPKLPKIVDYGVLTILASPLFDVMQFVHNAVGNWGWTIILVTLLIKIVFYPLTAASGRSMAKMRELAPRLKKLQERYADDRQALSREMMELYKREKINPAAGCLPLLIQMPFFFAFYWVLLESVEMRQAPFMLWINDLSSRDPYFVLPLLNGIAMYIQQKLNPAPPDPMQARIMSILPVAISVMFAFFPAGLVLYWVTNTALTILQQWRINNVVAKEQAATR